MPPGFDDDLGLKKNKTITLPAQPACPACVAESMREEETRKGDDTGQPRERKGQPDLKEREA